ncbi:MAG: hypothetical protein QXU59_00475 [Pyrobaculum sp.]
MFRLSQSIKCPICRVEFTPASSGGYVACPNGHIFKLAEASETLLDCEIRDWDRFSLLPQQTQQSILEIIQNGRVPPEMLPLMRRLKDAGVVVCT